MMRFTFYHFNFNVLDLERSLKFYDEALGLKPVREKSAEDGSYKLIFLGDGVTGFQLELTWLRDHKEPYDLGEGKYTSPCAWTISPPRAKSTRKWAASAL